MSATASVVRLDAMTVRPYRKQFLILIAVGLVFMITMPAPSAALPAAAIYAAIAAAYPFSIGDKADLSTLLGTLPVQRNTVILGRYGFATAMFAAAAAIALPLVLAVSATRSVAIDTRTLLVLLAVSFALFTFTIGIQFPIYFALGYTRARMIGYLPFIGIVLVAFLAARLVPESATDPTTTQSASAPGVMIAIAIAAVGLVMLAASAWVSCRVYNRRDL